MASDPLHQELLRISREIGQIQADQKNTNSRMDRLEKEIKEKLEGLEASAKEQDDKLDKILEFQAGMHGGWKAATILGSVIIALGALVAWVVDKWGMIKTAIL